MLSASRLRNAAHQVRREWAGEFIIARKYLLRAERDALTEKHKPGHCPACVCAAATSASTAEGYWAFAIIDLSA